MLPVLGVKHQEPCYSTAVERDPHPAPLPPTSTRLVFTSRFALLLPFFAALLPPLLSSPPLSHILLHTFALSLLLAICISSSQFPP